MKTTTVMLWVLCFLSTVVLSSCAPKVMTQTRYTNNTKIAKFLSRNDGETFSRYLQVCDLDANGNESNCQETLILDRINNAVPWR